MISTSFIMDTKVALTCLVQTNEQIKTLRSQYDPAYSRWPLHFNIDCFPFFPADRHDELAPIIQLVCANYQPIDICLSKINRFEATKKKTGTLFAEVMNNGKLKELYDNIQGILFNKTGQSFHPHVTLGRFDSENAKMTSVEQSINGEFPINFTLMVFIYSSSRGWTVCC